MIDVTCVTKPNCRRVGGGRSRRVVPAGSAVKVDSMVSMELRKLLLGAVTGASVACKGDGVLSGLEGAVLDLLGLSR